MSAGPLLRGHAPCENTTGRSHSQVNDESILRGHRSHEHARFIACTHAQTTAERRETAAKMKRRGEGGAKEQDATEREAGGDEDEEEMGSNRGNKDKAIATPTGKSG